MRRGAKPAKAKVEAKPPIARKARKGEDSRVQDLETRLAEALKREAEAQEQQTATSEILRVIARSPTNLRPVLDAIAANAALVCGAYDAVVVLREGDLVRRVAHYGPITSTLPESRTISRGSVSDVVILDRKPVHVHDMLATDQTDFLEGRASARESGFRTVLAVPLLRANEAIGALNIRRREVQTIHRRSDQAPREFCRPGRHRRRECPPVQRDQRGAGAADSDR